MNVNDLVLSLLAVMVAYLSLPLWADLIALARSLGHERQPRSGVELPRLLFLVPAHDEEALIARCVDSIVGSRYPAEALRTVVIADNCTDRTAEVARARGAECLERHDAERRGKPHAIAWALDGLERDWDAVVIVDADSEVAPDFALSLARQGPLENRVVQAYFGIRNPGESWLTRLADLLNWSTYRYRYVQKSRAGLNCPMTGNGMCIGREVLAAHPWRTASLTENWELYAQYTTAGVRIAYARDARLLSQEARTMRQGEVQRQRWTAGRFDVLRRWAGPVLRSRAIGWAQKLDCIAELSMPSPVLHLAAVIAILAVGQLVSGAGRGPLALAALATLLPQGVSAVRAFVAYPEKLALAGALPHLPIYMYWRCRVLLRTVLAPRPGWTRSARHVEVAAALEGSVR